eukprot:gene10590-11733_t
MKEITKDSTCIALFPSISQLLFTISLSHLHAQHSFVLEASLSGQWVVWAHVVDPHCRYGSCLRALAHHLLSADITNDLLPLGEDYRHTVDLQAETNPEEFFFMANLLTAELDEEQMALLGQRDQSRIFYFQYPRIQKDQASIFPLNGSTVERFQVSLENPIKNRTSRTIRNMTELEQLLLTISSVGDSQQQHQEEEVLNHELWMLLLKGGMELCNKHLQPIQQQWHEAGGVRSLCGGILKEMHRTFFLQLLQVAMGLPKIQWRPQVFNKGQPFIFLHLEKTAGTTLRDYISTSAETLGVESFVGCHAPTSCLVFSLPTCGMDEALYTCDYTPGRALLQHYYAKYGEPAVMAGHFSWGVWQQLPSTRGLCAQHQHDGNAACPRHLPALLFVNRHPVSRVISQYYDRCFSFHQCNPLGKTFNQLSSEELTRWMIRSRFSHKDDMLSDHSSFLREKYATHPPQSIYEEKELKLLSVIPNDYFEMVIVDESLSDAGCRMLLNQKKTSGVRLPMGQTVYDTGERILNVTLAWKVQPINESDYPLALNRLDHVVVGIQEQWEESVRVINHFFPWINFAGDFNRVKLPTKNLKLPKNRETIHTLRSDLRDLIIRLNPCDMILYEKSVERMKLQLAVLDSLS